MAVRGGYKLAAVSIDLDGLNQYRRLHGLALAPLAAHDPVVQLAPGRLAALLAERRALGTFFAIGAEIPAGGEPLRGLAAAGHEIGNHTLDHPYALTQLSADAVHRQIEGGAAAIAAATGRRPRGFRAPGYTLSAEVLRAVAATGHTYDSSAFPAVPYYLAKAAVMAWLRLRGRRSSAVLDRLRVLSAPRNPYHPHHSEPYRRGRQPLVEIPIAVDPVLRLPFIGTLIVRGPRALVRLAYQAWRRSRWLNVELHGVDLLGPADGIGDDLRRAQADLAIAWEEKAERLRMVLGWLARDFDLVTLEELAGGAAAALSAPG